jgi:chromosome segregation ATPase
VAETELEEACAVEEEQYELIKAFRRQLGSLERAVGRINVNGNMSRQEVRSLRSNQSVDANGNADESQVLRLMEERDELVEEVARLQKARSDDQEGWNEEKYDLLTKLGEAEAEAADSSNTTKSQTPARGNGNGNLTENDREQMRLLQEELEAQWERTEKASEELRVLRKENAELKSAVTALQEKNGEGEDFEELESTNQELANQLNDVLAAQQALEEERDQVRLSPPTRTSLYFMLTCFRVDLGRTSFV